MVETYRICRCRRTCRNRLLGCRETPTRKRQRHLEGVNWSHFIKFIYLLPSRFCSASPYPMSHLRHTYLRIACPSSICNALTNRSHPRIIWLKLIFLRTFLEAISIDIFAFELLTGFEPTADLKVDNDRTSSVRITGWVI